MEIIILLSASFGMAYIITDSELFFDVRNTVANLASDYPNWFTIKLDYLVNCVICTGVWCALIITMLSQWSGIANITTYYSDLFIVPMLSVPFNLLFDSLLNFIAED